MFWQIKMNFLYQVSNNGVNSVKFVVNLNEGAAEVLARSECPIGD